MLAISSRLTDHKQLEMSSVLLAPTAASSLSSIPTVVAQHTRIREAHAVFQPRRRWAALPPGVDVRLDHHARDAAVTRDKPDADCVDDVGLVVVIF
ncbi:hypothetical protein FIBSPDRAFT_968479 [Athelia psychrophila]|uniref:Uncharacterized protein n=1 Tax=Athelia psychrophila TaxID=1759441 RepID=A0A167UKC7_9AGAM|nr:hypothetical protein FIBSPDRAFT_968479 [Fibularhizoctonia sp. CBS 109695]